MSSRRKREKRAARRAAAAAAGPGCALALAATGGAPGGAPAAHLAAHLAPHTRHCECRTCERRRESLLRQGITWSDGRGRAYVEQGPDPEHKAGWAATGHALARYMATHDIIKRKNKVTHLAMEPEFLAFLDGALGRHDLDAGLLYEALLVLEFCEAQRGSPRGRIVRSCCIEGRSQTAVAQSEHMTQQAVAQNLDAALEHLLWVYGGLLHAQRYAVAPLLAAAY